MKHCPVWQEEKKRADKEIYKSRDKESLGFWCKMMKFRGSKENVTGDPEWFWLEKDAIATFYMSINRNSTFEIEFGELLSQ